MNTREEILDQIKTRFEAEIPYALAIYRGHGGHIEDDDVEDIERFEILNVAEEHYDKYLDVVSEIRRKLVKPNGFSISVHALSPESTIKHRSKEIRIGLLKRCATAAYRIIRESWDHRRLDQAQLVGIGSVIKPKWEMTEDFRVTNVLHRKFKKTESKIRERESAENKPESWDGNGSVPMEMQTYWPEVA